MSQEERIRSRWWYILPIFFQIIGGVIAYFILRNDDPKKAKNCLWLGIVLTAIKIGFFVIFISICTSIGACADFHDEFMSGMKQGVVGQGMMGSEMKGGLMQDPQAMNQWMNTMMNDPTMRQQMMDSMMNNPQMMQSMMNNPDMMNSMMGGQMMGQGMMGSGMMNQGMNTMMSDSDQMQLMEDMMADMMERMQTDPELKQAMMEHMARMQQMNP